MKRSRFTESQIVKILKSAEQGVLVTDICREHGISNGTFYKWRSKYGGMDVSMLTKVKELEAEIQAARQANQDNVVTPVQTTVVERPAN